MIDKSSPTPTETPNVPTRASPRGSGFALFIATLALIFTLIGIAAGYRHWQRMHDKLEVTQEQLKKLQTQFGQVPTQASLDSVEQALQNTLQTQQQEAEERLKHMTLLESQTRQFADTVSAQMMQITQLQGQMQTQVHPNSPSTWQLAEIQFLLNLAHRELTIAHNKEAALAALKEADKLLLNLGSVDYLKVRQQIARDIGALENHQQLDINTLYTQINELRQALTPPSTLPQELVLPHASNPTPSNERDLTWWGKYTAAAKDLFNESFIIQNTEQPLKIELNSAASTSLYQLLTLRLEALQLLLLQQNKPAFEQQIDLISQTIEAYYKPAQAAPLLAQLAQLKAGIIGSAAPDISSSVRAFLSAKPNSTEAKP